MTLRPRSSRKVRGAGAQLDHAVFGKARLNAAPKHAFIEGKRFLYPIDEEQDMVDAADLEWRPYTH